MFVNEELNNSKSNYSSNNFPLYFSPYIHKKKSIGNLYTEPRKAPIEKDSNSRNKNKKIDYSMKMSNSNSKNKQDGLTKSLKLIQDKNKKGRNMHHQSYMKINSKLYLKKNVIPNLASFHDINNKYPPTPLMKNSTTNIIMSTNSIKSVDKNNLSVGKNKNKNGNNKNIKLIFGKNNINYNTNSNNNLLKKTAGSVNELFRNNFMKKSKTNNLNNQIGYILSTTGNATPSNKASFLSSQNFSGQKIIFLKNDNKIKDPKEKSRKNSTTNSSNKDSKKISLSRKSENSVNVGDINLNLNDRNKSVQYLLRNTYNNVKIYPTTVLNNKIIYQDNKKREKICHSVNNSVNSSLHNSSKKRNEKTKINLMNHKKNNEIKNNEYQSVEEIHYLLVKTIHNSRNMIINIERKNK